MTAPQPTTKRCAKCHEVLPVEVFSTNPAQRSGLSAYCRPCARNAVAAYRATEHGLLASREASRRYADKNRRRNLAARQAAATS